LKLKESSMKLAQGFFMAVSTATPGTAIATQVDFILIGPYN